MEQIRILIVDDTAAVHQGLADVLVLAEWPDRNTKVIAGTAMGGPSK